MISKKKERSPELGRQRNALGLVMLIKSHLAQLLHANLD
jgi:hypothetical protein